MSVNPYNLATVTHLSFLLIMVCVSNNVYVWTLKLDVFLNVKISLVEVAQSIGVLTLSFRDPLIHVN